MEWTLAFFRSLVVTTGIAVTMVGALVILELATGREPIPLKARLRGASFMAAAIPISAILGVLMSVAWGRLGFKPWVTLEFERWFSWAGWFATPLSLACVVLVIDFFGYWFHRLQHGPFWRFHAVHHSIEDMHAVGSYGHPGDSVFSFLCMTIPMSLIPFGAGLNPVWLGLLLALQLKFIHCPTTLNFGPLRCVLSDNNYHRIHHSIEPRHFHKNYGTLTTVWDRTFGTAYFPAKDEWPATGLAEMREPRSVLEWLDLPLRYGRRS